MDDREWAMVWTGYGQIVNGKFHRRVAFEVSNAEIAEAVRVKYVDADIPATILTAEKAREAPTVWILHGPLAFISAVREVVDDR